MNTIFTKISSLVLAFLILISTFSVTIEKHFCGDFLVDVSYFGDAEKCSDKDETCDSQTVIKKKKCCKDEVQQIEGQDELQKSSEKKIKLEQEQFIIAFVASYNNLFKTLSKQIVPHKNYLPPKLTTNKHVLYEVYII